MKYIAIAFCFVNWIVIGLGFLMGIEPLSVGTLMTLIALSPFITAGGLLIAYREGQWSMGLK